ncbi:predicted protein, partial [Arabidopsis lyrata subsp. lyrata]
MDGYYNEASEEPSSSSSSGSLARSLFHEYRQSVIPLQNHVPSMAFMNNLPYVEIRPQEIQRLAFNDAQRLFYQMKIEASLREWFPEDFNRKSSP